jgi:hypothetical protein
LKTFVIFDPNEFEGIIAVAVDRELAVEACERLEEAGLYPEDTLQVEDHRVLKSRDDLKAFVEERRKDLV